MAHQSLAIPQSVPVQSTQKVRNMLDEAQNNPRSLLRVVVRGKDRGKGVQVPQLKELLVGQLQDILNAENQLVAALPKMAGAANDANLKQAFEKHLAQTEVHAERLETALELLGEEAGSKPCKGMKGLLEEGQEAIDEAGNSEQLSSDLALIAAAQRVEHYEISAYGTARCLAKHLGEREVAKLLSYTLGEEEATDFMLTALTQPLLQEAMSVEVGNGTKTPWGEPGPTDSNRPVMGQSKAKAAVVGKKRS
jgi:ferritin-like metal-binding protein YciE